MSFLLRLLFPPLCLHCQKTTGALRKRLCPACLELLELLSPEERCPPFLKKTAAAFAYFGPAASLVRELKYRHRPYLAKDAAAFMLLQLHELGWDPPDLIVPVPQSLMHGLVRGYHPTLLIAQALGGMLERPVANLLKRRLGIPSQTGLDEAQRRALPLDSFLWKKYRDISDQKILLIDDVMTTGTTLHRCAAVLQQGFPISIHALAFCAS